MKTETFNKKGYNTILVFFLFFAFIAFFSFSTVAGENDKYPIKPLSKKEFKQLTEEQTIERVQLLEQRIQEINKMDKNSLSPESKKELKKEVRDIKKELKAHAVGIYIGGSALLIIILLIILL